MESCSESGSRIVSRDVTTPLGVYNVKACDKGVHHLGLDGVTDENFDPVLVSGTDAAAVVKPLGECNHPIDQTEEWLAKYFGNNYSQLSKDVLPLPPVCLPINKSTEFERKVWTTLAKDVGFGKTISYSGLADIATNNSKASRAVGTAMKKNPVGLIIPCHRVIRSDGNIGLYAGGKINKVKKWLLDHEAPKTKNGRIDLWTRL